MMDTQGALIIFAKAPVAGKVKTRLIPDIGCEKATGLYCELLTKTLDTATMTKVANIHLWVNGDIDHPYFKKREDKQKFKFFNQTGQDLGQRMFNAFELTLKTFSYAVLIGSDCPSLLSSELESAMTSLENGKELILGPAEDGGYYLIGLRKNHIEIFSNIEWGGDDVFSETYARAKQMNLDIELMSRKRDIDRLSDLNTYLKLKRQEAVT